MEDEYGRNNINFGKMPFWEEINQILEKRVVFYPRRKNNPPQDSLGLVILDFMG